MSSQPQHPGHPKESLPATPAVPVLDLFGLSGKTALVTGTARGIGASIATALAQAGAHVLLAQRDVGDTATRDALAAQGLRATLVQGELAGAAACEALWAAALAASGGGGIQILVNNAGTGGWALAVDQDARAWDDTLDINVNALFHLSRCAGRHMIAAGTGGSIINVLSILSFLGGYGMSAYVTSKTAGVGLTKSLALEWARHGIRVNALAPGSTLTDMYVGAARPRPGARLTPGTSDTPRTRTRTRRGSRTSPRAGGRTPRTTLAQPCSSPLPPATTSRARC